MEGAISCTSWRASMRPGFENYRMTVKYAPGKEKVVYRSDKSHYVHVEEKDSEIPVFRRAVIDVVFVVLPSSLSLSLSLAWQ
jgi:hypothetical protein